MLHRHPRVIPLLKYFTGVACILFLAAGLWQGWLQLVENRELNRIAKTLVTGSASGDVEAVVDFVYQNAYISEGRYGLLRASALDVLSTDVGGQCGDFVRLSINLLNQMGYPARRVYLFPAAKAGTDFDPLNQVSFHVLAEIQADGKWVAVDVLRGITFRNAAGQLVSVDELYASPELLTLAMQKYPREVHDTIWGTVDDLEIKLYPDLYTNPQRMNWNYLAHIPGAYELARLAFGDQLPNVAVPLLIEQPHTILAAAWLLLAFVSGAFWLKLQWSTPPAKPRADLLLNANYLR